MVYELCFGFKESTVTDMLTHSPHREQDTDMLTHSPHRVQRHRHVKLTAHTESRCLVCSHPVCLLCFGLVHPSSVPYLGLPLDHSEQGDCISGFSCWSLWLFDCLHLAMLVLSSALSSLEEFLQAKQLVCYLSIKQLCQGACYLPCSCSLLRGT